MKWVPHLASLTSAALYAVLRPDWYVHWYSKVCRRALQSNIALQINTHQRECHPRKLLAALHLRGGAEAETADELIRRANDEECKMLAEEAKDRTNAHDLSAVRQERPPVLGSGGAEAETADEQILGSSSLEELMQQAHMQELNLLSEEKLENLALKRARTDVTDDPEPAKKLRIQQVTAGDAQAEEGLPERRHEHNAGEDGCAAGANARSAAISERTRRLIVQALNEEMLMLELEGATFEHKSARQGHLSSNSNSTAFSSTPTDAMLEPSRLTSTTAAAAGLLTSPTRSHEQASSLHTNEARESCRNEDEEEEAEQEQHQQQQEEEEEEEKGPHPRSHRAPDPTSNPSEAPSDGLPGQGQDRRKCGGEESGERGGWKTSADGREVVVDDKWRLIIQGRTACGLCASANGSWGGVSRGGVLSWCATCEEALCGMCLMMHGRVKLFANHSLTLNPEP